MKQSGECPKCGSTAVVRDAKAIDHYDYGIANDMQVGVQRNPQAWIFKNEVRSTLSAYVCGECGYTEFYADEPGKLR